MLKKVIKKTTGKFDLSKKLLSKKDGALYILLFALVIVLFVIAGLDIALQRYNAAKQVLTAPILANVSEYPILSRDKFPDISAKAALVMDKDSQVILFTKNASLLFSMASTAKIMTALIALDYYKLDDILTIKTEGVGGITIGLKKGEKVKFEDLLYGLLLPSSNDAAMALAQNYKGGEDAFIDKMNEYAKRLSLFNTSFRDPAGLDEGDYTTPLELARLASIALKNKLFSQIVATKQAEISSLDGKFSYSVSNLNQLLGIDGINGIKTGFTEEAGQVLVSSKETADGHTLISVVMNSKDRFSDTKKLLDYISKNLTYEDPSTR